MAVEAIPDFVMCVTDLGSEQLAQLRLTTGEGPCHDVLVVLADPRGGLRVAAGLQPGSRAGGAIPAAERSGTLPGLLPHWPARLG
jgi:hypothetical protein